MFIPFAEPSRRGVSRRRFLTAGALGLGGLTLAGLPRAGAAGDAPQGRQADDSPPPPLCVSGVYPHLAVFNNQGECGIGAVVPWAGKLWMITYPPHEPRGSPDKLYAIDPCLRPEVRPESVGGTHACRMIHRESNQLIIGPYFIDARGGVRAADLAKLVGRLTGVARHLTDPANKVYFYDMEGAVYEVDVHRLAVTRLFDRAAPGAHGKGAYTGQGRLIVSNNGDWRSNHAAPDPAAPDDPEAVGALAQWDGKKWAVVERRQFTEVTGPGGLYGSPDDKAPVWAVGWDRRSVLLEVLDGGDWSTFRLPKASHAYDPRHGWYTEWPRIREVAPGGPSAPPRLLMDMHGMFYDFPSGFRGADTAGVAPLASHLRMVPDFCGWDGKLVLATDEASVMQNPMLGQSQSNLWFGAWEDLITFGPASGWGGPWLNDPVKAGEPSQPFLVNGFRRRVMHLYHDAPAEVRFTLEVDAAGDGKWAERQVVAVPARGYAYSIFPEEFRGQWVRVRADHDCRATAYFHLTADARRADGGDARFRGLAGAGDAAAGAGIVRPGGHNRNLQFLVTAGADGKLAEPLYLEVDERLSFSRPKESRAGEVTKVASLTKDFEVDDASVILTQGGKRYRLPRGDPAYDRPFAGGWPRGIRECVTERFLVNVHGTFYEMPREDGLPLIKPVCTHNKQILDFCTWRGLLVVSGVRPGARGEGHTFLSADGAAGLWFGAIDDLWSMGTPAGVGGPWAKTAVKAGVPSDPYLMTGYTKKRVELSHDAADPATITLEVDVDHTGWRTYRTFTVPPGRPLTHQFPEGFSAHWVRAVADRDCTATVRFTYDS